jgi:hypothetical protein
LKISKSTFCLKTKSSKKFKKIRCFNPQAHAPSPDFHATALQPSADKTTTSIQVNKSNSYAHKRQTENSTSTAVCLSEVEERDGASFRSQVLLVTFVTTKVTRNQVQGF